MTPSIIKPGSPEWHHLRHKCPANPHNHPAIDPNHPLAPKHHPLPPHHRVDPTKVHAHQIDLKIVGYSHESLKAAGKETYTESIARSDLFKHAKPGHFAGHSADCSQQGASIGKWSGCKGFDEHDYTGSIIAKFAQIFRPMPGCGWIWGPGTGAHFAIGTEEINGVWYVIGFGHQGAPDRNSAPGMAQYFKSIGEPGVRYFDLTKLKK